jgi:hypothetical protein
MGQELLGDRDAVKAGRGEAGWGLVLSGVLH